MTLTVPISGQGALWRHEVRRAGPAALLAPPIVAGAIAGVAMVVDRSGHDPTDTLMAALEAAIPLATGVAAGSVVGRDPALELQLSLPSRYRVTLLRRFAVAVGGGCLVALALAGGMLVTGWWPPGHGVLLGQLAWLAPALWLAGLGLVAAALRSPAAAATLLVALWICEQLMTRDIQAHRWSRLLYLFATSQGRVPSEWTANRLTLLATSLLMVWAGWLLLGDGERMLAGERA
jgi:hypothetical protein